MQKDITNNKIPLDKKIKKLIKEDGFKENCFREEDVKSSLSNLKKRLKEEMHIHCKSCLAELSVQENVIDKLFSEEIGSGLLEGENGKP